LQQPSIWLIAQNAFSLPKSARHLALVQLPENAQLETVAQTLAPFCRRYQLQSGLPQDDVPASDAQ